MPARPLIYGLAIVLLACPRLARTQARDSTVRAPVGPVQADTVPPCCTIVRIDTSRSLVTARELATGYTFSFEVRTRRTLRSLKLGGSIWADFSRKTVTLNARDVRPCCSILPAP